MKLKYILLSVLAFVVMPLHGVEPADSLPQSRIPLKNVVQAGTAFAVNVGITEVLKHVVTERRPDKSGDDSFPSRHTSWAYNLGFIGGRELYRFSPWSVPAFHAVASAVGMQRVMARRHHPHDVLAGAAIGVATAELGYWLGGLFFPDTRICLPKVDYERIASFDYATVALFPLSDIGEGLSLRTGFSAKARVVCPLNDRIGLLGALKMQSLPVYRSDEFFGLLDAAGLSVGTSYGMPVCGRWGAEGDVSIGVSRVWGQGEYTCGRWAFDCDATIAFPCRIDNRLILGPRAGYSVMVMSKAVSMLTLSFFTQIAF